MTEKKPTPENELSSQDNKKVIEKQSSSHEKSSIEQKPQKKDGAESLGMAEEKVKIPKESSSMKTPVGQKEKISMKKTTAPVAKNSSANQSQSPSKIGIFSLIISLFAIAGLASGYYWYLPQQQQAMVDLINQSTQQQAKNEQQLTQKISTLFNQQKKQVSDELTLLLTEQQNLEEIKFQSIESRLASLSQNQPSDWLLHEAEYLVRVASRTMWLEQDTKAAVNLLNDADLRLAELNDPQYLPVRQVINEDIAALQLIPTLNTESIILQLMGLNKQVEQLAIAMAHLPSSNEPVQDLELTSEPADWKENLKKTWQRFLADFITVSRRTSSVEALLTPTQQQNLRQNLVLKLQLVQWAASQKNQNIYDKTLSEIEAWMVGYFDINHTNVTQFIDAINKLQKEKVFVELPRELTSLKTIREIISDKRLSPNLPNNEKIKAESIENAGVPEETTPKSKEELLQDEVDDNGAKL